MPTVIFHLLSLFWHDWPALCSLKKIFLTMLCSAIQQHESAPIMHISPSYGASLLYSHPISLDHHRAPDWTPVLHSNPTTRHIP